MASDNLLDDFLALSSALTGFSVFRLKGTGQAESYLSTATEIVGEATVRALLSVFRRVAGEAGDDEAARERGIRRDILSDDKLGPVARNLIKLWYVGTWYVLPVEWRELYAAGGRDRTFVVSPDAYTEGLLWPAVGANPSGAKPFGYGMWAMAPRIETD
ncbi:MAG: hypothetical protein AB7H90_20855 [Alphaproteobacteria bacterium]